MTSPVPKLAHQSPSPNSSAFTVRCEHIEGEQLDLVIVLAGMQVVAVASTRLSVSLPGNRRSAPFVHAFSVVNRRLEPWEPIRSRMRMPWTSGRDSLSHQPKGRVIWLNANKKAIARPKSQRRKRSRPSQQHLVKRVILRRVGSRTSDQARRNRPITARVCEPL